jgi:hypothetical protein
MPSRLVDDREQRRGLVLGLTLAEILLLLLFLLLLTLAAEVSEWQGKADDAQKKADDAEAHLEQLQPLQQALYSGGAIDIGNVKQLVERFQRLQTLETKAKALKEQNEALVEQSKLFNSLDLEKPDALHGLTNAIQQAAQIDPNDPPAALKRAVEILNRLGKDTKPEQVKPLSQMIPENDLAQKLKTTEAEREKYRTDVLNLMHSGNGLTYPSCWKTPTGQTEFIFDVTFGDRAIRVQNATAARAKDPAWQKVAPFARDTDINEHAFVTATKTLADWAKTQNCKFYTRNRDETGPSNKSRYKSLQRTVEQNFYPYYVAVPVARSRPAHAATSIAPTATADPPSQ